MADDARTGETQPLLLNRYRVEGMLGEGGLGTVVKAYDTRLKAMRAIKTLKRTITADPETFRGLEERFTREAEAGARMGINPNLVAVYDLVADTDGTLYLILEYVTGGTLADRIKQGPIPLAEALRWTADAARGLQAAHDVGIVHRDIKPANIFLNPDGRAQVGDFGIAQIDDLSARTRSTVGHPGTPLYMSPEQAHMTAYVQPATDQYSLGLTLYEMLVGKPYRRASAEEVAANLAQFPEPVRTLIQRMAAEQPGDRYPSTGAVLAAIQAIRRFVASDDDEDAPTTGGSTVVNAPGTPATVVNAPGTPATVVSTPPPGVLAGSPTATTNPYANTSGTPPVNLQPAAPVALPPETPAPPVQRGMNRNMLIGIGALVAVAIIALGAFLAFGRGKGASTPAPQTATAPVAATTQGITAAGQQATGSPTAPAASASTTASTTAAGTAGAAPAASGAAGTPATAAGPAPITSLLSYVDGKVPLPGEPRSTDGTTITGPPVQVVGVDLSSNEAAKLPAVSAPAGSRVVRTLWAPKGTLLATLVRQPVSGGFSDNLDLVVIDIATGKSNTVAKAINAIPAWSPDGTTLVYALIKGPEKGVPVGKDGKPQTLNGTPQAVQGIGYDVHLVNPDGTKDRVIAHVLPFAQCGGGGEELIDPVINFLDADQFVNGAQQMAWAADNSLIAMSVQAVTFTFQPDGSNIKQAAACSSPEMGTLIGATTDDPYIPANNAQVRLQDDADALHWRYERGLFPTTILTGCTAADNKPCDNTKKGSANAGYRNQIVARLANGTEKTLTTSPTFKYDVAISPDGTAVAFTAITMSDYNAALATYNPDTGNWKTYTGYTTDVYIVRITGGAEQKISTSGGGHHVSWQRDLPVKIPSRPTPAPTVVATLPATTKP